MLVLCSRGGLAVCAVPDLQCPQLVNAAIATQHGPVVKGQVRNMANADSQMGRAF